jgi:hypothetical protein
LPQDSLHRSNEVEPVDRPILVVDAPKHAFLGGTDGGALPADGWSVSG